MKVGYVILVDLPSGSGDAQGESTGTVQSVTCVLPILSSRKERHQMIRFALCKEIDGVKKYLIQDEFSGDVSNYYDLEKAILFEDEYIAKLVASGGETTVKVSVVLSVVDL